MPIDYQPRIWGSWIKLLEADDYWIKILEVAPGCALSDQRHTSRCELWVILEGIATVRSNTTNLGRYYKGETVRIPEQTWHQLCNESNKILRVVEIAHKTGTRALSELDIERKP